VQRAYDEACTALQVYGVPESEYPQIFLHEGVDPAGLVLVKTYRPIGRRVTAATFACLVTTAVVAWEPPVWPEPTVSDIACGAVLSGGSVQAAVSSASAGQHGSAAELADAKAFYGARRYRAAAAAFQEADNAEAMGCLGYMYMSGRGMRPQPLTGFELVHEAALDARDTHAMYALANAYLAGVGTPAREHLARHWFTQAAEKGFPEAMRSLGDLARQKMNDSSFGEALIWYQQAVDAGSLNARVDIGMMYEFGWGVQRDSSVALRWYQSAARAGCPRGMVSLGRSYQEGIGVPRDHEQAMAWYLKAARAGSAEAMNRIGVLYDNGLGVRKSHAKARRWYRRAEKAGSTLARGNLGTFERT
jgi:TPR repeat protein